MRAIIYIRVSTEEQAKYGYSLEAQIKLCKDFAATQHYEVVKVFADEGLSAKDLNRPAVQDLLLFCKKKNKIDAIIVWKLDRLCRNMQDYQATIVPLLVKNNIKLLSVTEGNDDSIGGELARNIWMAFAEYERKMIGLRVNAGMRAKAERGIYPSKAPLGYENIEDEHGHSVVVLDEAKAMFVRRAFELYATGIYSVDLLRKKLVKEGMTNKKGTAAISKQAFYEMLRNPFYTGVFVWKGKTYTNSKHKAIISPSLFYKVQDILSGKGSSRQQKHDFTYTGVIKCDCGKWITAEQHRGKVYYICAGKKNKLCTKGKYVREEEIEKQYEQVFDSIKLPEEVAQEVFTEVKKCYKEFTLNDETSIEALSKEIPKLEKKLNLLYEDKIEGLIDIDFFTKKQSEYKTQLDKIRIQIANKTENTQKRFEFASDLIEICKDASNLFKLASPEKKRILINLVQSNAIMKDEKLLVELKSVFYGMAKIAKSYKWYSEPYEVRTISHKILELSTIYFDSNVLSTVSLMRKII